MRQVFIIKLSEQNDTVYFSQSFGWTFMIDSAEKFDSYESAHEFISNRIHQNEWIGLFQIESYFTTTNPPLRALFCAETTTHLHKVPLLA